MYFSPGFRRGLMVASGLCSGVALGALLPQREAASRPENVSDMGGVERGAVAGGGAMEGNSGVSSADSGSKGASGPLAGIGGGEGLGKLPPEKLVALFERVSNLKSDSRKYILAYRIAGQLEAGQIEGALKAALQDLSDGDFVTTRALARRWVEIDPKSAAAKALELKQQHLIGPVLESWSRMDPAAPLQWALEQEETTKVNATRQLLISRKLDQQQLEKLVITAADAPEEAMRNQIFPFATARLAESNPQGALHAASGIEDPDVRQRTVAMVLGRVGQSAPEVGKAWLDSQPGMPPEERARYEQILANPRPSRRGPR
ncbi:MAG: hypothetical protein EBS01_12085 [Verrucomicrobia bacterium]|nr:hypothetical protein [Verrucomicrobiota bacterium]